LICDRQDAEIAKLNRLLAAKHQLYNIVCKEAERLRDELAARAEVGE
jgi:hypothetical protein